MYGGYAWLTNARTPVPGARAAAAPGGDGRVPRHRARDPARVRPRRGRPHGRDGLALGLGYLVVVAGCTASCTSASTGTSGGYSRSTSPRRCWSSSRADRPAPAAYAAVGGGPRHPGHRPPPVGRLDRPVRHPPGPLRRAARRADDRGDRASRWPTWASARKAARSPSRLALSAALGLALTASLWWAFFGTGDDDRAEESLKKADQDTRTWLALATPTSTPTSRCCSASRRRPPGFRNAIGHPGGHADRGTRGSAGRRCNAVPRRRHVVPARTRHQPRLVPRGRPPVLALDGVAGLRRG